MKKITKNKKIEKGLIVSNAHLSAITRSAQDAIIEVNSQGKILFWNRASERVFGYSVKEVLNKELPLLLSPKRYLLTYESMFKKFLNSKKPKNSSKKFTLLAYKKNGQEITVEYSLSTFMIKRRWYGVGIVRDISARIKAESECKEANVKLMHASKLAMIGTLAAEVAHEINNPMSVILCAIEIMQKICKNSCNNYQGLNAKELMNDILSSANRIKDIVKNLKYLAYRGSENIERIDLHQCIKETRNLLKVVRRNERIKIELQLTAKDNVIEINEGKIRQLIINLVCNAWDALVGQSDGLIKIITEDLDDLDGNILIKIVDNGIGISEENKSKIFEPFFTTKIPEKGLGLGIPICHAIVTSFGGRMDIESKEGIGTTVVIVLPKKQADKQEDK